jgi:hypothetical protein
MKIERKDGDFVMPGEEMQRRLVALDCGVSYSQAAFVAGRAGVSLAGAQRAVANQTLYRREWNLLARELGVIT